MDCQHTSAPLTMRAVLLALILTGCVSKPPPHNGWRPTLYPYLAYCPHPDLCADDTGRRAV